ncbi:MAG: PEP-CTERM sorting domain-containing protein [Bryobacteraceae bacterium]
MAGNWHYHKFKLLCLALLLASLGSATPISENFDNQALGVNGWTETGGNSATPTYNYNSPSNGLGCCPSPGFISAKDNNSGGAGNVLKLYAPLALFPQTAGFADLSSFDIAANGGMAYYIHFALKQLSNQGNKPLTGNTGKIDITGANGVTIQANLYNFVACPTCNNLPAGWNLPTENNLFSFGIFTKTAGVGTFNQALYLATISKIASFNIEVELHGDGSDEVGFDSFGIDTVPEPSYTVVLFAAGILGFLWKRRQVKVS